MSGAAAVSAAKNRRSREQPPAPNQQKQQPKQQKQEQPRELTLIEALHQHDFRLRRSEETLKHLLSIETANAEKNSAASGSSNDVQDTLDLFNERILSLEKYIDDELAKSLTLKEQEDKEGEDVIYGKINGLETLLKDLKSELVRIQSASRDTSVSFLKYKGDTDTQLKELKESVKSLTAAVKELQAPPVAEPIESSAVPSADE
jgi:hypothetical protein